MEEDRVIEKWRLKQKIKDKTVYTIWFLLTLLPLSVILLNAGDMPLGTQEEGWSWMYGCWCVYLLVPLMGCFLPRFRAETLPRIADVVSAVLMLYGIIEAWWGLAQLWGWIPSNHARFAVTGSFANPGPYSGFLAIVFPVAVHECVYWYLYDKKCWNFLRCMGWVTLVSLLLVLPAGMSRTAWIAALVSAGYVYVSLTPYTMAKWFGPYKKITWTIVAVAFVALVAAGSGLYHLKKDSADGRLLMWKVAASALQEHPLTGNGWNGVAAVYGQAQEDYFAKGDYTETEARVADAPEYVFNEYLQVALAWGIPVLVVALAVIGWGIYVMHQYLECGLSGGLIAFAIFAFASYPLQCPALVSTLALLLFPALVRLLRPGKIKNLVCFSIAWITCIVCVELHLQKEYIAEKYRLWSKSQVLYQAGMYRQAAGEYRKIYENPCYAYPWVDWNPRFLFEYARSLHKIGLWDESTVILKEALKVSGDPMILNLIGKNESAMYRFDSAEWYYRRAADRVPSRIYPYYLMVKLFSYRDNYQPDKLREAARVVLTKEPKVPSTAVRQMKEETRKILKEKQIEL